MEVRAIHIGNARAMPRARSGISLMNSLVAKQIR
jgi:hypothetical protein